MDIDLYIARNEPTWARLELLARRASRRVTRLEAPEVDELVALYQRTSAHLSYARTHLREPTLIARLTAAVALANGVIYGRRTGSRRSLARFFAVSFPGAVYHCRRYIAVTAVLFAGLALALGVWVSTDRTALEDSAPRRIRQEYVNERFEQYYSDESPTAFFTHVTVNNIGVSFVALALGVVSAGIGSLVIIARTAADLGIIGGWMVSEGDLARFLGFIVPHGALELSAIVIAGGAGLSAGWAVVAPGDRSRLQALRDEGQRAITVIGGLMTMFLAAGIVEGFVTGRGVPPAMRVGIGVLLWLAYLGYLTVQGRLAASEGITGLIGERPRTWDQEPDRWAAVT